METINDPKLLERFLRERNVLQHFGTCKPHFFLLHYLPGELLTNPFSPSRYLQFIVQGELLLYDMPDEESTIMLQTNDNEISLLGEVELLNATFTPFFVEARTDVYTLALFLERYQQELLNDPVFLRFLCNSLASKLSAAVADSAHAPLKKRVLRSIQYADSERSITNIGHLAKTLNVSSRQLIRVLQELCDEGILEHSKKGTYRVI